jgi:sugar phosphate isomerase/epimerase
VKNLRQRADDAGVTSVLIMCDDEGRLGDPDDARRSAAIENHRKWLDWASVLGCHAIRVNAGSSGSPDEQRRLAADGLARLTALAAKENLNVIVENHGGLSSNGQWLASVIKAVNHPRCGTLPDFGNFRMFRKADGTYDEYDRYQGVVELMPFAKGVSAKSYDFNDRGEETTIDYRRMMKVVVDAGYHGRVGVEYEGDRLSEPDGIRATKALLERVRGELAAIATTAPASQPAR